MLLNPETEIFYSNYEKLLTSAGICFLHNEHTSVQLKGNDFVFHGLELPVEYYHKPNSPALSLTAMEEMIGTPSQPGFHVLLAHNPKYGNTYFSWGADLILSGHYHGGVLRLVKTMVSPVLSTCSFHHSVVGNLKKESSI